MNWVVVTVGFMFFGCLSIGQTIDRPNAVLQMEFPSGSTAWLVQVFTSGGFAGSGAGDFGITSEGRMVCSPETPLCPQQVEIRALEMLIDLVPSISPPVGAAAIGLCNDCLERTIVIRRRSRDGTERTYRASWNDLTTSSVSREILQIYAAVTALRK